MSKESAACPVTGKVIQDTLSALSSIYQGQTYYFCCPGCKKRFDKQPDYYLSDTYTAKCSHGHCHH